MKVQICSGRAGRYRVNMVQKIIRVLCVAGAALLLLTCCAVMKPAIKQAVILPEGDAVAGQEATLFGEGDSGIEQDMICSGEGDGDIEQATIPSGNGDSSRSQVALTFDDGPHPVYTELLLDGLKERGVHATFFVVGKNIPGNEALIRRMDEEGHLIGNHTYDHVKISGMEDGQACAQVEKTSALVREITGKDTEFVRPPFGSWDKALECPFEMIPVLWDVDPLDWTTSQSDLVVQRVLKDTKPGDIILLHDFYESSVEAALEIVDTLQQEGYEFVTVDKLILE